MKKAIATATIAAACILSAPAQAHCPNACTTGWRYYTPAALGVSMSQPFTGAWQEKAVNGSLNRWNNVAEGLIPGGTYALGGGWVYTFADFGYRYTPARAVWLPSRYLHNCKVERGSYAGPDDVRVRCNHGTAAH